MSVSRKRKGKSFYKSKFSKRERKSEDLRPNMQGFLITCNVNEKNAVFESYRLLNEYADEKYGPEKLENSESDDKDEDDVEEALKKQVAGIKNANKKDTQRRFQSVENKAKHVLFIKTTIQDPTSLVEDIFSDLLSSQTRKTKFCLRMLPVINTCYAKVDEIVKTGKVIIEKYFHGCEKPFTFCIMWRVRCNNSLKREDVLTQLVEFIYSKDCGHTTDYKTPDIVFNLDIVGNICCFGFLKNFHEFKKYNLDSVVTQKPSVEKEKENVEVKCGKAGENAQDVTKEKENAQNVKKGDTEMAVEQYQKEAARTEDSIVNEKESIHGNIKTEKDESVEKCQQQQQDLKTHE